MFLQQPKTYLSQDIGNWWVCEKLSGIRCFWDGGISRGYKDVPWCNKKSKEVEATGLWDKNAQPIQVSDAFLNKFPSMPLDGILCGGEFAVFGTPPIDSIFSDRENEEIFIDWVICQDWIRNRAYPDFIFKTKPDNFQQELMALKEYLDTDNIYLVKHVTLPSNHNEARIKVEEYYETIIERGGQGLLMRDPLSEWEPGFSYSFLEYAKEPDYKKRIYKKLSNQYRDVNEKQKTET